MQTQPYNRPLPIYNLIRTAIAGCESQGFDLTQLAETLLPLLMPDQREVDTHEAAAILRKSVPTLERWRWKGYGPKYRKDDQGLIRYRIEWLTEFQNRGVITESQ